MCGGRRYVRASSLSHGWHVSASRRRAAMLILTRKVDQGIVISGNILVRVLGVERDRVKIGISAPGEITVLRQEIWRDQEPGQTFERKDANHQA
jgi:carbon storage regulator CsrA